MHYQKVAHGLSIATKIDNLEWPWTAQWLSLCAISRNTAVFEANCIKLAEAMRIPSATKAWPEEYNFWQHMVYGDDARYLCGSWASCEVNRQQGKVAKIITKNGCSYGLQIWCYIPRSFTVKRSNLKVARSTYAILSKCTRIVIAESHTNFKLSVFADLT